MKYLGIAVIAMLLILMSNRCWVQAKSEICSMEPRKGKDRDIRTHCNKVLQYWSYDASKNTCTLFIYSGCGGNQNKFFTQEECESFCKD